MAWSAGEMILGNDGEVGLRTSNSFAVAFEPNGNGHRILVVFANPAKLSNPDSRLKMRLEVQEPDGSCRMTAGGDWHGNTDGPGGEPVPPFVQPSSTDAGKLHRATIESETEAHLSLWLQYGQDD